MKSATENIDGNTTASWKQTFTYDRYGNRNFDEANTTTLTKLCGTAPNFSVCPNDRKAENPSISPINNRIIEDQDNDQVDDYKFDLAGNTTEDVGNNRFTYDGENKQIKVETIDANGNITGTVGEYWYDGDGKRVKKKVGNDITIFVYNGSGQLVAEYATQTAQTPTVSYLTSDHLGSPRITTDANGDIYTRRDFMPFGEEIDSTHTSQRTETLNYATDEIRQKFTTYERDEETELDFAQARMYSYRFGHFTSPDNFLNDTRTSDTQSWNLYVYSRNNPLYFTDPNGERVYVGTVTGDDRTEFLRRANYTYGCESCVGVDGDGYLTVDTTGLSQEIIDATQFLTDAINSTDLSKLFNVEVTNNNPDVAFGDAGTREGVPVKDANGKVTNTSAINIRLDFGDDAHVRGSVEAKASFLNLVFAHEISHFYPTNKLDPKIHGIRGSVVNPVNEIRLARGLPLRSQYLANNRMGVLETLRFGRASTDPKFGTVFRGTDGIVVENETSRVILWFARRVKQR